MCLITTIGKCVICILNGVFVLISLLLIAFGFLLRYGSESGLIKTIQDDIIKTIKDASENLGTGTVDTTEFSLTELLASIASVMIVLGFIFLAVSVFGFFGACCEIRLFLLIYIITILVLVVAQIIGVALLLDKNTIAGDIKTGLRSSINTDYKGIKGANVVSLGWNFVMQNYDCCGVDSYQDFQSASQWNGTLTGTHNSVSVTLTVGMPLACCKNLPSNFTDAGVDCAQTTSTDNFKSVSCFDTVYDIVLGNTTLVVLVFLAAIGIQAALIIFAFLIIRENSKIQQIV